MQDQRRFDSKWKAVGNVKYNAEAMMTDKTSQCQIVKYTKIYNHRWTVVPSCVNDDIAIQWEWSNFDPSQNPNPLSDYD